MVGDRVEIQRTLQLNLESCRVQDGFAASKRIRVIRGGFGTKLKRIERIPRVDMQVAEIRIARCFIRKVCEGSKQKHHINTCLTFHHHHLPTFAVALSPIELTNHAPEVYVPHGYSAAH